MEPFKFEIGSKVKSTDIYGNTVCGAVTLCTLSELNLVLDNGLRVAAPWHKIKSATACESLTTVL